MAYGSIDLALGELTASGLVEELDGGRERRVRLCTAHRLGPAIATLFQVESDFFAALRIELRAVGQLALADGLLAAAVIGSVARREESIGDGLEILLIASDSAAVDRVTARFEAGGGLLAEKFGATLKLVSYDLATARAMWRTRTPAAEGNVKAAELLVGTPPLELLNA